MVKKTEFTRKDGTKGYNYTPELNDKVEALYKKVFTSKKGLYENHSLKVRLQDGKEIYLNLTNGQKKSLETQEDLKNKTLEFVAYKNDFGNQIGVRVL